MPRFDASRSSIFNTPSVQEEADSVVPTCPAAAVRPWCPFGQPETSESFPFTLPKPVPSGCLREAGPADVAETARLFTHAQTSR